MNSFLDDTPADELAAARRDLEATVDDCLTVWQRQSRATELRHNIWEGQSADGRKHSDSGEPALPFEGSADSRIPLLDGIINDKVAMAQQAFWRAEVQASPIEPGDTAQAASVSTLLRWLRRVPMREELRTEIELSAQYLYGDDPGIAVVAVDWLQDTKLVRKAITFDEVAAMYVTGASTPEEAAGAELEPEMLADFIDLFQNPAREREVLAWLASVFPSTTKRILKIILKGLRREGAADVPLPKIRENRPTVTTLRYGRDVFFPVGTADLQRARRIHRVEWLNEEELFERVVTQGWDADVVDDIIKKGKGQSLVQSYGQTRASLSAVSLSGPGLEVDETQHLIEIIWSYERRTDELGIAGIYLCVWNSVVKSSWLWAGLCDFDHGKYPFVMRTRERLGRQVTDSRGLSRALPTHQNEIKVQRDARSNNTQLIASPPMKRKLMAGAAELILGPASDVPVQKLDDFELINYPALTNASMEMEGTTRNEANHYSGILTPDSDPNRVFMIAQAEADNFNALWCGVFDHVLALCQQYYSPAELALITGGDDAPLGIGPDDIAGRWNVALEIDARDLNMDFVIKKLDTYNKLLSLDPQGVIDRTQAPAWGAAALFPGMAGRLIQPMAKVTQRLIDEEESNVAKMALGMEPRMSEDGIDAPETRLQAMQGAVGKSPRLGQQWAMDPEFRALLENRQKFLMQQLTQEQNKVVGRLGTAPLQGQGAMGAAPMLGGGGGMPMAEQAMARAPARAPAAAAPAPAPAPVAAPAPAPAAAPAAPAPAPVLEIRVNQGPQPQPQRRVRHVRDEEGRIVESVTEDIPAEPAAE